MARIRSVHWDLCRDRELADVSAEAERTFVRLWPHLDDEGRALDDPLLLKADLYPVHAHITAEYVEDDLCELAHHGLILRYEKDGVRYLSAKPESWAEYQKPRHRYESKLPGPTDDGVRPLPPERVETHVGRASATVPPSHVGRASAGEEGLSSCEVEGGAEPERVPQCHDLLPPGSGQGLLQEVELVVAELRDVHGDAVDLAVQNLLDDRRRFTYPSKVRTALQNLLGPAPAKAKSTVMDEAQRAQMQEAAQGLAKVRESTSYEPSEDEKRRVLEQLRARKPA